MLTFIELTFFCLLFEELCVHFLILKEALLNLIQCFVHKQPVSFTMKLKVLHDSKS